MRRGVGRGAAVVARRRLGSDARGSSAPRAQAVGVRRRARVVHDAADRGARRPAASACTRSSRRDSVDGCCSRPTTRTGTSTRPSRRCPERSGPTLRRAIMRENALALYGLPAERPAVMDTIDCDVQCAPASYDALFPVPERLLAPVHHRGGDPVDRCGARLSARRSCHPRRPATKAGFDASSRSADARDCGFQLPHGVRDTPERLLLGRRGVSDQRLDARGDPRPRRAAPREPRRLDHRDRGRGRRRSASGGGPAFRPGPAAGAQRPAVGPEEQPSDLRRSARTLGYRSVCTHGGAPARRPPPAGSRRPTSRTTLETSRSPRRRC